MIRLGPWDWRERITRCQDTLGKLKPRHQERVRAYAGPGYTGETNRAHYDPISHTFNAISTWMPLMVSGLPRVSVDTSREEGATEAQAIEAALNRLIHQSDLATLDEMLACDFWIGPYAAAYTTMEPVPGFSEYADPVFWPTNHRIPPFDFLFDTDESQYNNWRFMGHRVVMDWDDAMDQAEADPDSGWDRDALGDIAPGIPQSLQVFGAGVTTEDREQFEFYEIWCPEVTAEDLKELGYDPGEEDEYGREFTPEGGYHGAIFYVLTDGEAGLGGDDDNVFVRAPHMYYGPRWGPYTLFPGYFVPDEGLPLAPGVATVAQEEAANTGARAMLRAIDRGKTIVAVASSMPDLADEIEQAEDGSVITIKDAEAIKDRVVTVKAGGLYPELAAGAEYLKMQLREASGMDEAQYGRANSDTTATAVAVASRSTSAKIGFLSSKFRRYVERMLTTCAWYLYHDERVEVALGKEHGHGVFRGGPSSAVLRRSPERHQAAEMLYGSVAAAIEKLEKDEASEREHRKQDPFDTMDFSIVQYSMERSADGMAQAQLLAMKDTLSWLPMTLATNPFLRAKETVQFVEEMGNVSGLDRIIDYDVLNQYRSLLLQVQLQPTEAPQEERLGRDQSGSGSANAVKALMPRLLGAGAGAGPKQAPGMAAMPGQATGALAGAQSTPMKVGA